MKPVSRRSVTTGLAAAVTAIPALALGRGAQAAAPVDRIKAALHELEAALTDYYPGAKIKATFNETSPERLDHGSIGLAMVIADKLDEPIVLMRTGYKT